MGNIVVPVDSTLCATLKIGSDAFPFMLFHDDLNNFVRGFVNWHKQKEIEISVIIEGSVRVCLLNEEHRLYPGDIFTILPGTLHSIQPVEDLPGKYFTLIFDPCLLTGHSASFFEQSFYTPVISSGKGYYCLTERSGSYSDSIRKALFSIYDHDPVYNIQIQLEIQRTLQDIWLLLFEHVFQKSASAYNHNRQDGKILDMLEYLHTHYAEKFSLNAMAEHHHISRGECCRYFKKMMGMTITEFLLDYRLSKAAQQLTLTQASITGIAYSVGFHSASHFTEEFRKKTGQTPTQYRISLRK